MKNEVTVRGNVLGLDFTPTMTVSFFWNLNTTVYQCDEVYCTVT